jgi:2,3-bisphosphoglycerate-independent phosphoglycerate mutase
MKLKTIEDLDKRLIGRIIDAKEEDWIIGLLTDHATPISTRTHSSDPVPFAIWGGEHDDTKTFNEVSVKNGFYKSLVGDEFMKSLLDT